MKRHNLDCREIKITTHLQGGKRLPAVLALATLLALGMSPAAWAGVGGAGGTGSGGGSDGGAGGGTSAAGPGPGTAGVGAGGGAGGTQGSNGSPATAGGDATDGTSGGGGGGAGATGFQTTGGGDNPAGSTFDGGPGGAGGAGSASGGGGGGGGAGGNAIGVTAATGTITNEGTLNGGTGGAGGTAGNGNGGDGGAGGSGIVIEPLSGAVTFSNTGTITGGAGGAGGSSSISGTGGAGGDGGIGIEIQGSNVTVINAGVVTNGAGGLGGLGVANGLNGAAGNAILLNGDNETLQLQAGSSITGNVVATGANETLDLGGSANSTFDASTLGAAAQYQGFGSLTKDGSSTWTLTGVTTFTGSVTVSAGILEVSSQDNFGTGALTLNGGEFLTSATTAIGSNLSLGAGTTNTLAAVAGTTDTYTGIISDLTTGGALTIGDGTNTGTLVLGGTNTYSGGTTVTGGATLEVASQSNIGTGSLTLTGGEFLTSATGAMTQDVALGATDINTLAGVAGTTTTYSGVISDLTTGGALTIGDTTNTGTIVLGATNTYSGGTTVTGGATLEVASQNNIGTGGLTLTGGEFLTSATTSMTQDVALGATDTNTLAGVAGTTTTYSGVISDLTTGGTLAIGDGTNTGTIVLSGTNTYSGGTTVIGGATLEVASQSNIGTGSLTLNGGELLVNDTATLTRGATLTTGVINTLAALDNKTATFSGSIGGTGNSALTIGDGANTGTIVLTGTNNQYSGGTEITGGATLAVVAQGSIGTGPLTLNGGEFVTLQDTAINKSVYLASGVTNTLAAAAGTTADYVNTITDNTTVGALTLGTATDTGTVELSGANTYSGGTTVAGGTVVAGNSSALGIGDVTLNNGTLTTTGTGGTTINVTGNYTQTGGTLALHIASATDYDTLSIGGGGVSSLNGTLKLIFNGAYSPANGQTFNLITTTNGTIDPSLGSLYLDPVTNLAALRYTATGSLTSGDQDYVVTIATSQQDFAGLFGGHYLTPNQLAVANNVDGYLDRNGGSNRLITALDNASYSPAALSSAFNQLMPLNFARFASSTAFNNTSFLTGQIDNYLANHRGADGSFLSSTDGIDYSGLSYADGSMDPALQGVHSRLLAWNPAPSTGLLDDSTPPVLGGVDMKDTKKMTAAPSDEAPKLHFFVAGNAILAQDFSDANTGLGHEDDTTGAVQLGVDYAVTPHFLVGALFGFGHTDADLDNIGSTASVDTYSPGVYASYSNNGWYANALGSYGFSSYTQHRNIQFGGLTGTAQSNPDGDQIVGNLDGGYDFHQGHLTYGPTAGVQYVHLDVDSYNEYGLPAADLSVNDDQADSLRSRVGGRVSYAMQSGGVIYTPHLAASWQHEFLDQSRGITSQFDGLGAGSFEVQTQSPSRDSALIDTGLDAEINKTITVFGDYTVQAGQSNYFGQSVQAGVKLGF